MNEAIKLAIEKGEYDAYWDEKYDQPYYSSGGGTSGFISKSDLVLDPLFWRGLGKALNWDELGKTYWLSQAEGYFHTVMTQGDLDAFWKRILIYTSDAAGV